MIDRHTLIWILVALTVSVVPHLTRLPVWFTPLLLAVIAYRAGSAWKGWPPLSRWLRVSLALICLAAVMVEHGTVFGRSAGIAMLAVMLTLKITEVYRRRDALFVTALCYFVVITQFLFSQSIIWLPYLAIAVLVTTAALTQLSSVPDRGAAPSVPLQQSWAHVRGSGMLLVQALPIMVVAFVLFPRLASPMWGLPDASDDSKTGLSDEMSPGSLTELFIDDSPAFRVRFENNERLPSSMLYWRGPVFWDYDGRSWTPNRLLRANKLEEQPEQTGRRLTYEIEMEPSERHWMLALDYPYAVPDDAHFSLDHQVIAFDPISTLKRYTVTSIPDYVHVSELTGVQREAALALPEGYNPRTIEMMNDWRAETPDPAALVRRALNHFNTEEFSYSFNPPLLGANAVDDFLYSSRNGYCEHYSSAFTFMMRAAGIPARVVTGYQGGFFNPSGNYYLVRQSDAHAWSEVWLGGQGWTRVDPTAAVAPERISAGALGAIGAPRSAFDFSWVRALKNSLDTINALWNNWVVNFDSLRQRSFLSSLGLENISTQFLATMLVAVLTLITVLSLIVLLRQPRTVLDPASRALRLLLRKLKRLGFDRRANEGVRTFLRRVASQRRGDTASLNAINDAYEQVRYADSNNHEALSKLVHLIRTWQPNQ